MITGIDETGSFDPNSHDYNFFVAVHIDQNQNRSAIKKSQFNIWESLIPHKFKTTNGEIKGQLLPDEYIDKFYDEVLNINPSVSLSIVRFRPLENSIKVIEQHKDFDFKSIEKVIEEASKNNDTSFVNRYQKIAQWYKNRNYQTLVKMKCLNELLGVSLNHVLGLSQLSYIDDNNDDSNFKNILFKIDKDFVKAENVKILWEELLKQFWQNYTTKYPMPVLEEFPNEPNPIFKYFKLVDGKLNIKNTFKKNTAFVNSEESWEVRMADLTGTIFHRFQNHGKLLRIGNDIKKYFPEIRENLIHLIFKQLP